MNILQKTAKLKKLLKGYGTAAVAFSGGSDSSFLARIGSEVLGDNIVALTVDTFFIPRSEMIEAKEVAEEIDVRYRIVELSGFTDEILGNPENRCYLCKKIVFSELLQVAQEEGADYLLDGTNIDDMSDYRPGLKALDELKVKSPLLEVGFSKAEIREASRNLGLSTWDKPSQACLASRIPYHQKITPVSLKMVEEAENYLRGFGIKQVRVRYHQDLARIEVSPDERARFFDLELLDTITFRLKEIGFRYVTFDTEGYRMGKLNNP